MCINMITHNKRIRDSAIPYGIVLLIVVWLSGSIIPVCCAKSATDEPIKSLSDQPYTQHITASKSDSSLFANDPNFWAESDGGLSTQELFYKMMFAILLVVILGTAAIYISKKFVPRITSLSGKQIQISETVHLGPRKAVHLIKVGNRQLLIGSTNESITKLADVTDTLAETNLSTIERTGE